MTVAAARAFLYDLACVVAMVIIGTRNHDTDTGFTGVLSVAAPFVIALLATRITSELRSEAHSFNAGVVSWVGTVTIGMLLRHFAFDRGTAVPFIIVAATFLAITMLGWRVVAARAGGN